MRAIKSKLAMGIIIGLSLATKSSAQGQSPGAYPGPRSQTLSTALSPNDASRGHRQSPWTSPAMRYFVGERRQPKLRRVPRQPMPLPQPVRVAQRTKPFSNLRRSPTISPYLALDQLQSEVGLPNYYAYVRPLMQQQEANQLQRSNLQRMERQLRAASATGIASGNPSGGMPTTGHSKQFLNTGGFFPGR